MQSSRHHGLVLRIALLTALFAIELTCVSLAFDGASLTGKPGLITAFLRNWGAISIRIIVAFLAVLGTFSFLDRKALLSAFSATARAAPLRWQPLCIHAAAVATFAWLGQNLYLSARPFESPDVLAGAMLLCAVITMAAAALAVFPFAVWRTAAKIPGSIWAYATGAAILIGVTMTAAQALWLPASRITFQLVRILLSPIVPLTIVNPAALRLGTSHFSVIISPQCSGLEGIALLFLFGGLWLILFRRECRFPQALLLLPLGALILFALNSVRIAALLLIGHAGAPQIAAGGFHSQAGWLSFNAVSFGLCIVARRLPWFTTYTADIHPARDGTNPTAIYLMPFLAILGAGMISHAMTGAFEWMYPLRLIAPLAVFYHYRQEYKAFDWHFGWTGVAAGVLVFVVWIALDQLTGTASQVSVPSPLRDASGPARTLWIGLRAVAAIVTVPVAEELAFRGFLLRRLSSRDFDTLPATAFSWPGLLLSSALFGALHGSRWPAGVLAGLIYGLIFLRRGKLGDAIIAHAVTNALIAANVLLFGAWQYW